jgi:uncharacterized protein with von Willebrand factor type A (vWA) domain
MCGMKSAWREETDEFFARLIAIIAKRRFKPQLMQVSTRRFTARSVTWNTFIDLNSKYFLQAVAIN